MGRCASVADFWSKAFSGQAAASPPQQQTTPAVTQRPWWDAITPTTATPEQVQPQPTAPSKAVSARSTQRCPDCGSENYFQPQGMPNAMRQCYECGYNPRFAHSTAGAGMPTDSAAPAQPARQISTSNNYNPGVIVAKVE